MSQNQIPKDWHCKKIHEISKSYSGGTPRTENPEYWENGTIPWLRSGDLEDNILNESQMFITEKALAESSAKLWPKNSVLIAITGANIGKTAFLSFESSGNQSIVGILPNDEVLPKFLWYYLQYSYKYFWSKAVGGAQPHINGKIVSEREITYPNLETQEKIIQKLDYVLGQTKEKKNEILELNITKKLIRLQRIILRSFLDIDNLKKKFGSVKLEEIIEDARYGTSKKCGRIENGIGVIRIPNIKSGELDFLDMKYANFEENELGKITLRKGDIVVCRTNGSLDLIGKTAIIRQMDRPFAFASYLIRLRPKKKIINSEYLNFLLSSNQIRSHIESKAKTSAGQYNINLEILKSIEIPLPTLEIQDDIVKNIKEKIKQMNEIINIISKVQENKKNTLKYLEGLNISILNTTFSGKLII